MIEGRAAAGARARCRCKRLSNVYTRSMVGRCRVCGCLYLEVVEIVHDLIVVHVQVVDAERVGRVGARLRARAGARVHGVAHYRGALHLRGAATCDHRDMRSTKLSDMSSHVHTFILRSTDQ